MLKTASTAGARDLADAKRPSQQPNRSEKKGTDCRLSETEPLI